MSNREISYRIKADALAIQIKEKELELANIKNEYNDCFYTKVIHGINISDLEHYLGHNESLADQIEEAIDKYDIYTCQLPSANPCGVGSLLLKVNKDNISEKRFSNLISKIVDNIKW